MDVSISFFYLFFIFWQVFNRFFHFFNWASQISNVFRDYFFFYESIPDFEDDEGKIKDEDIEEIVEIYGVKWINGKFKPPKDRKRDPFIRFTEDLDILEGQSLSFLGSGEIEVNPEYALPIKVILLDAMVRYGYEGDQLLEYIFNALGVLDQLGL